MTLDEAIKHAEEMAYEQDMKAGFETDNQTYIMSEEEREKYRECAAEHRQLAKWLKDYKRLLGAIDAIKEEIEEVGYAKDEYGDIRADVLRVRQVLNIIEKHISGGDAE